MNLNQAYYMVALSEELSFTAAARRCRVSQPTLTNSIERLEQELGRALFVRKPKVAITPFGWEALPYMYRMIRTVRAIKNLQGGAVSAQSRPLELLGSHAS